MNKRVFFLPILALAACGQEPAAAPAPTETVAPAPVNTLPAPNEALFTTVFAAACPKAEAVSKAVCKRAGMGSSEVICEFGLGEDEYMRHTAKLAAGDDKWTLADGETVCAQHDSHHVPS